MNSIICDAWVGLLNSSVQMSGEGEGDRVVVDDWGLESPEEGFETIGMGKATTRPYRSIDKSNNRVFPRDYSELQ